MMRQSQISSVLLAVSISLSPAYDGALLGSESTFVSSLKSDDEHSSMLGKPMKEISIVPTNDNNDVNYKSMLIITIAMLY